MRSLSELQFRVQRGRAIRITGLDGKVLQGRFDGVLNSDLRLRVSRGKTQNIAESGIKEIQKRRPESRWNGVLIGLGVGVASGLIATAAICDNPDPECSVAAGSIFIPTFVGGGAGIGALIDFSIKKYDPVYVRQATSDRPRFQLSPLASRDKKAIQLTLSF